MLLLGFFAFGLLVPAFPAKAAMCEQQGSRGTQTCKLSEIKVQIDTYIGNQFNQPDNFVRVGKNGSLVISGKLTLVSPDSLNIGQDQIDFKNANDGILAGYNLGIKAVNDVGSFACKADSRFSDLTLGFGDSTSYVACNFPYESQIVQRNTVRTGETLHQATIAISGSDFQNKLGITAAGTYKIYVYPVANILAASVNPLIASGLSTSQLKPVYQNSGKEITVQVYNTQAEADQAKNEARPSDVPAYGSVSGAAGTGETGGPLLGLLVKIVNFLIGILQEIIFGVFYLLIAPIMQAVLSIRTYTDTFAAVIYPGWEIIRNLCNIIFIIALIAIAMGTLLRVEKYQYKHLLVQLILAALLINFSLVIGQAILGVADTVQNQFLPNSTEVIRALAKDLMVGYRSVVWNMDFSKYGYISSFAQPLFFLALSLGSFCVFLAIAAFLVIRMAMLWILLMISPIAYAAGVLPQTEHYRTEWWTTFLKYAFFTPIMAFFLNMTAIIANTYQNNQLFTQFGLKDSDFGGSGLANFIFRIGSNLLLLVFLMVALMVAEKFSIYGAGAISKIAKGGIMAPFAFTGWGAKNLVNLGRRTLTGYFGEKVGEYSGIGQKNRDRMKAAEQARKVAADRLKELKDKGNLSDDEKAEEAKLKEKIKQADKIYVAADKARLKAGRKSGLFRALSFFDPKVVQDAWKAREHEKEMKAYEPAVGYMQDTLNRIVPTEWLKSGHLTGKKTFHGLVAKRGVVSKETKELLEGVRTREDAFRIADAAFDSGDKHLIHAAFKILQHGNWQDDYMNARGRTGKTHSIVRYMKEMHDMMEKNGFDEEEELEVLDDLQETGEADNRFRAYGYRCTDKDGAIRAAYDLSYIKSLDKAGQVKELGDFESKFRAAAKETGVKEFEKVADTFLEAAKKVDKGTNINEVLKDSYNTEADARGDETLENAIIQRRFLDEANIKLKRGGSVGHARALEAAIFADQDPERGWENLNLLGKMALGELPPTILKAWLSRMHEGQARALIAFGALQDGESGKWQLPDFEKALAPDDSKTVSSDLRRQHKAAVQRMVDTFKANKLVFSEIVENKQIFGTSVVNKFKEEFEKYVTANPQTGITVEDIKKAEKDAKEARGRGGD